MTTDYGSDLGGVDDLDENLTFVEGPLCWAQAILCRLGNVPGTCEDEPTNGYDLTLLIGSSIDPGEVSRKVVEQAKADERTASARCVVRQIGESLDVRLQAFAVLGASFSAVLDVSAARVAVVELNLQEAA